MAVKDRPANVAFRHVHPEDDFEMEMREVRESVAERCVYEAGNWHTGGGQVFFFRVRRADGAWRSRLGGALLVSAAVVLTLIS